VGAFRRVGQLHQQRQRRVGLGDLVQQRQRAARRDEQAVPHRAVSVLGEQRGPGVVGPREEEQVALVVAAGRVERELVDGVVEDPAGGSVCGRQGREGGGR